MRTRSKLCIESTTLSSSSEPSESATWSGLASTRAAISASPIRGLAPRARLSISTRMTARCRATLG